MHQVKVVHCDLKPENILVRADSSVCIADFGNCYKVGSIISRPGTLYWPFGGHNAGTTAIDLYSLGVIISAWFFGKSIPNNLFDFKKEIVAQAPNLVYPMRQLKSGEVLQKIKSTKFEPKSAVLEILANLSSDDRDSSKITPILKKSYRLSHGLRIGQLVEEQHKKFVDAKVRIKSYSAQKKTDILKKKNFELQKKLQDVTEEYAALVESKDKKIKEFNNEIAVLTKKLEKNKRKKEKKIMKHNEKHEKQSEKQCEKQSEQDSSKKKGRRVLLEVECIPELFEKEQIVKGRSFKICHYVRNTSQAEKKVVMEMKDGQKLIYSWVCGFKEERKFINKGNAICKCCPDIILNSHGYVSMGKKGHGPNCSLCVEE